MGCLSSKRSDRSDPGQTNDGPNYPDLSSPNRVSDPGESITGVPYPDLSTPKVKGPRHQPEASRMPSSRRVREEHPAVPKPATRPHGARDSQERRQKGQRSKTPAEEDNVGLQRYTKPDKLVATERPRAVQDHGLPEQSSSRKPYQAYVEDADEEEEEGEEEL